MKLNKKHFDIFKKECEKYIKILGLQSWNVYYEFKDLKEDVYANCTAHYTGRVATIKLNLNFDLMPGIALNDEIKRVALHECLELLLSPMVISAESRMMDKEDFSKEIHIVIRTLEKLL